MKECELNLLKDEVTVSIVNNIYEDQFGSKYT